MKKGLFFSIIISAAGLLINSCNKAPVYPDTPQIKYNSVTKYVNGDSLIITIDFKDGDGDLGLRNEDIYSPYQEFDYAKDGMGNYIKKGSQPSMPPYNCKNYRLGNFDSDLIEDTVLIYPNINYNNYIIDIYIKQVDNTYIKFDVSDLCPDFNQRFPLLNPLENKGPIEGNLSYTLKDLFSYFGGQTLKFSIYIFDRKLNKSNVIETPDIVMN